MSRIGSRRRLALIGLTVALALVLTSCFGGEDEPEEPTTTTAGQVAPTTQPPPPTTQGVVEVPTTETVTPTTQTTVGTVTPTTQPTTTTQALAVGDDGIVLYTVESGDTLFSIAQRFGVTLDDLVQANNISNPDVIFEGDTLTIPLDG